MSVSDNARSFLTKFTTQPKSHRAVNMCYVRLGEEEACARVWEMFGNIHAGKKFFAPTVFFFCLFRVEMLSRGSGDMFVFGNRRSLDASSEISVSSLEHRQGRLWG